MTPDLLQVGLDRALIAYFGTAFDVDPASAEYKAFVAGWVAWNAWTTTVSGSRSGPFASGWLARATYEREVANAAAALESESTASGE